MAANSTENHVHNNNNLNVERRASLANLNRRASIQEIQEVFPRCDAFLLKKWEHIFSTFFDRNHSHQMDWDDFYLVVKNTREIYGRDSKQYNYAKESMQALWSGLCKLADSDANELITLDEWIDLLKKVDLKNRTEPRWFIQYQDFMFKLFDVGEDGYVDLQEYIDGMSAYGFGEKEAKEAFELFAIQRPREHAKPLSKIDREFWKIMFLELFFSSDPEIPSNNLFGKLPSK
ncbi:calexcitin-1 [Ditylenchus destructor]|nr:calexcitin-1 [Ditylenchus destructor]